MIRRDDEECDGVADGLIDPIDPVTSSAGTSGVAFTLYLEFLGGLIPLLKVTLFIFPCQKFFHFY